MSIYVNVKSDFNKIIARMNDVADQVAFATALALTEIAVKAKDEVTKELPSIFNSPTPFTMKAIAVKAAKKGKPQAMVFVRDRQADYLLLEETGGQRTPTNANVLVIPTGAAKKNKYGNLPRGYVRSKADDKKNFFIGTIHGKTGLWQRLKKGKLRFISAFKKTATYTPRFHFHDRVIAVCKREAGPAMQRAMAKALATRKPKR